jgi:hypothetical protein
MPKDETESIPPDILSFTELSAWHEFTRDAETFFRRGAVVTVKLPEGTHADKVRSVVGEISARHDIFRTSYHAPGGRPARHVLPLCEHGVGESRPPGPAAAPAGGGDARLMPGDLFRAWVSPGLGEPRAISFGLHEMITDNLSCARLSAEVSQLISGEGTTPLEASYAEYAREERHRPIPPDLADYWRRAFAGLGRLPAGIPADGPDPSGEPAGEWILILPDHLGRALRAVSQANRVSLFMVVTAILNMTIASMYGAGDIALATTASTRTKRFANVQGNFSNVTVTRTAIPQGAPFTDVLTATREAVLGTLRHQPVPFPQLRDLIGETLEAPQIRVHYLPRHTHHYSTTLDTKPSGAAWKEDSDFAGWPLDLGFAEDSSGRVAIWANYDPRLFTHATVRAVVGAYQRLLELVAADGTLTCRDLRRQVAA